MTGDPLIGAAALFGGAAVLCPGPRALLLHVAPRWIVGPGDPVPDTRGRPGLLQMRKRHDRGPCGDGGCG